ncbi:hypothetical protein [Microbacterium sp. IEGM 1404]|uniref:hypothetical protein n=1 Tax=Microbacterium sp. IEGM 1404 TaxID=3047084 RepID=UPI0024B6ECA0|nr:hypothetical protein [Microbacterium sp. IEGM 1404]MDI9890174.1 hypothetical protein [Microbacterium sp. IEGM 1404]
MSVTIPSAIPAESLRAWYDDEPLVSDVALYDMTAQGATTLASVLIERQLATADEREREYWAARVRLVNQQRTALDPDDRLGLIAQQQAWLDEIDALTGQASRRIA